MNWYTQADDQTCPEHVLLLAMERAFRGPDYSAAQTRDWRPHMERVLRCVRENDPYVLELREGLNTSRSNWEQAAEEMREADAEIARLTRELEEARTDLKLAAGTTIEDALLVPRAALSQLRADRDEARQALEAERARVAELEGALNQIRLILDKPAPDPGCHSWERFGQHMLTAFRESEVIACRALAAEGGEG